MTTKVVLGDAGFRCLVRGGQLIIKTEPGEEIHMILSDIGYVTMTAAIQDAISEKDIYKGVVTNSEGKEIPPA